MSMVPVRWTGGRKKTGRTDRRHFLLEGDRKASRRLKGEGLDGRLLIMGPHPTWTPGLRPPSAKFRCPRRPQHCSGLLPETSFTRFGIAAAQWWGDP